jgi:hypothetical protein
VTRVLRNHLFGLSSPVGGMCDLGVHLRQELLHKRKTITKARAEINRCRALGTGFLIYPFYRSHLLIRFHPRHRCVQGTRSSGHSRMLDTFNLYDCGSNLVLAFLVNAATSVSKVSSFQAGHTQSNQPFFQLPGLISNPPKL